MTKRKKSRPFWGIDIDTSFTDTIAESWMHKGFDVEEFFAPDVDANDFRVEDENGNSSDDVGTDHECRYIRPTIKPIPRKQVIYEKAASLANNIGLLNKGERVDVILSGKFILGDFIEAYMVEHNLHSERLIISTLSFNENNVDSIRNLLEGGYIDKVDIIVSAYFYSHEKMKLVKYAYEQLDDEQGRFQLAVCNVHTKTYQFRTDEGLSIMMQGSGNMRAGANFENMVLEENEEVFDFYQKFYDEILQQFPTIQKDKKYLKTWFKPDYNDEGCA